MTASIDRLTGVLHALVRALACAAPILLSLASMAHADESLKFDIAAQPLVPALKAFAEQSNMQLLYKHEAVEKARANAVIGSFGKREALTQLLRGSGLEIVFTAEDSATIRPKGSDDAHRISEATQTNELRLVRSDDAKSNNPQASAPPTAAQRAQNDSQEIIVTGTQIRGTQPSSAVVTITQEQMRLSGYANLGEVARAMPQNFSGGQNPGVLIGGVGTNANFTGSSSLNLRGLGPDATLTLLNGNRLPYDGYIQAIDVSVIPLAAIDRMEVVLDGASALYGSDAVGGVANIILKRDYQGAEISARYGAATDGGFEQQQYNGIAGTSWGSGGLMVTADLSKNSPVYARQRDYLAVLPPDFTLFPDYRQNSALLSGHQRLSGKIEFALDAFYTDRDTRDVSMTTAVFDNERDSSVWGFAPSLHFDLPNDWSARVHGTMGRNENAAKLNAFSLAGAPLTASTQITQFNNKTKTAGVSVEGPLFQMSGGQARASFGAGYRGNEFAQIAPTGTTTVGGSTHSRHAYGEINLPLLERFTVNGALRYEDDAAFGEEITPKTGFIWKVLLSLDIKASWGKSFKAPTLTQRYQASALYLYPGILIQGMPAGTAALYSSGGSLNLEAEHAEVITAGFIARPAFLPGFSLELNWFDIDYTDRVLQPIPNVALALNASYADFVTRNPTVAEQNAAFAAAGLAAGSFTGNFAGAYVPANVGAYIRNAYANASADRMQGVDLTASYSLALAEGQLTFSANGSWIDGERQLTGDAAVFDSAGANFYPTQFKGRLGAAWSRGGFTLTSAVNHLKGITNINFTPNTEGGSMTTIDLVADYRVSEATSGALAGVGFNLAAMNLFDRAPPYLRPSQAFYPPFDSTNYSPLGRTVAATISKRF